MSRKHDYHKLLDKLYEQLYLLYFNHCTKESFACYENYVDNFLFALDYHFKRAVDIHFKSQLNHLLKHYIQLIVYTRNMYWGLGRKMTAYVLLYKLYKYYPDDAIKTLHTIYDNHHGSWCDLKYFCNFIAIYYQNRNHPLILCFVDKANSILSLKSNSEVSNIQKWLPRESGAYAWLFHKLWKRHGNNMTPQLFRKTFIQNSDTLIHKRPCMLRPGKLLKSMMSIIQQHTIFTPEIQEKINVLNLQWQNFENTVQKCGQNHADKHIIPFLDLSNLCDDEAYDMMAWAYFISSRSLVYKRIFVSTSISNWFNFEACLSLYDVACKFSHVWKQYGKLNCVPDVSLLLLQQSFLDSQTDINMNEFTLVFLYSNHKYDLTTIQNLYKIWTYGDCKPNYTFWNFNGKHFYNDVYDGFNQYINLYSGFYCSTFDDIINGQYKSESNMRRFLNHLNGISIS